MKILKLVLKLVGLLTTLALTSVAVGADPPKTPDAAPTRRPQPVRAAPVLPGLSDAAETIDRDVTYGRAGAVELKMDLYFPKKTDGKALPVAMYVHGGGWRAGDKAAGAGAMAIPELVKRGYLVASINYRLAPEFKFPAQIEDAKCAVRFLRANADKYHLDPKRIGVWGGSAGGHLVALLGTADASAGFEGNSGHADQSSRVQAVVDMFGPADLTIGVGRGNPKIAQEVFGATSDKDEMLKRASPVSYVSRDDPPFLILHGDQDKVVALDQSKRLLERLKEAGVPATLVVVKNAGHGFVPAGGELSPSHPELIQMIADFFDKNLRRSI
ncbi:MAG: alpha/beta hydrolase [Verrucomicrobia bacterium]|nr:alpha/beta hydrolase [Verrucomicrobiota bacterium]